MTEITVGTTTATTALVPVFFGTLQGQTVQLCEARALHAFMSVLRDFTNWIKGRIQKFGFVEGIDFIIIKLDSPNRANQVHGGDRKSVDYHLTLDMAKELSMVENNAKGREARRYFMECEKQVLAALKAYPTDRIPYSVNPGDTLTASQAEQLRLIFKDKCDTLPKDDQAAFMTKGWSKLKSHFGVTYRKIEQREFSEAINLATRHAAEWGAAPQLSAPADSHQEETQMSLDVKTLCAMLTGGMIDQRAVAQIASAANMQVFKLACNNPHRGYGQEVAQKISDLGWADLHAINVAASMEIFKRTVQVPVKGEGQ
jgi:phage anti-repressor protein